jgi:hypothetical protein
MLRAANACTVSGAGVTVLAGRSRLGAVASSALLAAGSLLTRFGVFYAGMASARDPKGHRRAAAGAPRQGAGGPRAVRHPLTAR